MQRLNRMSMQLMNEHDFLGCFYKYGDGSIFRYEPMNVRDVLSYLGNERI